MAEEELLDLDIDLDAEVDDEGQDPLPGSRAAAVAEAAKRSRRSVNVNMVQDLAQLMQDFGRRVQKSHKDLKDRSDAISGQMDGFKAQLQDIMTKQRENAFVTMPEPDLDMFGNADDPVDCYHSMMQSARPTAGMPQRDLLIDLQAAYDRLYYVNAVLEGQARDRNKPWTKEHTKALRCYKAYEKLRKYLFSSLDTATAGEGLEWVPTGMSAQIRERVNLELTVANLFDQFNMPTDPFDWPFETANPEPKLVSQQGTPVNPYDELTAANLMYSAGQPTAKKTFATSKIRALFLQTRELNEAAVVATLPFFTGRTAFAIARGWEISVLHGDTAATHFDTDTTGASNVRKAVNGIRDYVQGAGGLGAAGEVSAGAAAPTIAKLRAARAKLGRFGGVGRNANAYICSLIGYIHLLNITEVLTAEKFPQATIVLGELARVDNTPIVISPEGRDDVDANGVNAATGNTKTSIQMVYRPGWLWGMRPGLGVETERVKLTDQYFVVMFDQRDFKYLGAVTDPVVVDIIDIPNTV